MGFCMFISVNKKTKNNRPVTYSVLSSGTISHVWYDEETSAKSAPRRRNRIQLIREILPTLARAVAVEASDA